METPAEFPGVELSLLTSNFFTNCFSCREKVIMASGQLVFLFLDIKMIFSTFQLYACVNYLQKLYLPSCCIFKSSSSFKSGS